MIDYTETYMDPTIRLDNGKPVMLWVRYYGSNTGDCIVSIKGVCNPLPFNKMVVPFNQATRLKKWLKDKDWKYLGYSREI